MHEREKSSRHVEAPRAISSHAPSASLIQKGIDVLRRVGSVQALVALTALACIPVVNGCKNGETANVALAEMPTYTPEAYPTVERRLAYLKDKYDIEAAIFDHDENTGYEVKKTEHREDVCGCENTYTTEEDIPKKIEKGDPKNFPAFLDGICRAVDKYPLEIFEHSKGLKIYMSGKIEMPGNAGVGGFTHGTSYIVLQATSNLVTQSVFFHEFFHLLDAKNNAILGGVIQFDDTQWITDVGSEGKYIGHGNSTHTGPWAQPAGFARKYGSTSVHDDQATVGEDLLQPYRLKFILRRAKYDKDLRTRIQLISGCVIDLEKARFSRTMTEEEYKEFSGFDKFRYYYAWAPKMDHTFWNSLLDEVAPESSSLSESKLVRNMDDASADVTYHYMGDLYSDSGNLAQAAEQYENARETKLAKETYLAHAKWHEDHASDVSLYWQAWSYEKAGEKNKANVLYEKLASQVVTKKDWYHAAVILGKVDDTEKAHKYAEKYLKESTNIPIDQLMTLAQECYGWHNLPSSLVALLRAAAAPMNTADCITIFEKLHSKEVTIEWYLKMAKDFEYSNYDLMCAAYLYEEGGNVTEAKRCLNSYMNFSAKAGQFEKVAAGFRKMADLSEKEISGKSKSIDLKD